MTRYLEAEAAIPAVSKAPLNRQQIVGFWAAWTGRMIDCMGSVICALVRGHVRSDRAVGGPFNEIRAPREDAMAEHATPATCGVDHVG